MSFLLTRRAMAGALIALAIPASAALAHHGWSWADEEQTELSGTVRDIYIGQPHPTLQVETASDGTWTVELANPRQTERSGFREGSASPGDPVTALGHKSSNHAEKRMKAVRITIRDKVYDLYPDRIQKPS